MNMQCIFDNFLNKWLLPNELFPLIITIFCSVPLPCIAADDLIIYEDSISSGWDNWSWDTLINPDSTLKKTGAHSLAIKHNKAWVGFALHTNAIISSKDYMAIHFWVYGSPGSGLLRLYTQTDKEKVSANFDFIPMPNTWQKITIPLSKLNNPTTIARLNITDVTGKAQVVYYIDDLRLIAKDVPLAMTVDVAANRKPISEYIYGVNNYRPFKTSKDESFLNEISMPIRRWGGNDTSRYNYLIDGTNTGQDSYFENTNRSDSTDAPYDSAVNRMVDDNYRLNNAETLLTIPMIGFVAKEKVKYCGFSIAKYGSQTAKHSGRPDCGNGIKLSDGKPIKGNSPSDTSIAVNANFVKGWVKFLADRAKKRNKPRIKFYNLDNEPDLWYETHRDVFPIALTYDQLRDRSCQYATAIKSVDPKAKILGPSFGTWTTYWKSPYDKQLEEQRKPPVDQKAHGNTPMVAWYLQQMKACEKKAKGIRLVDYLDLHYYPQFSDTPNNAVTQALRLRSTRSLWDPTYVDESWIGDIDGIGIEGGIVKLIPRMKAWVKDNYPSTKIAISEYMWGDLEHINGALAQADVLGIFGREGLDLATLWGVPTRNQPGAYAFRMYRNYNGKGGKFGNISVLASSTDQGKAAIYAAQEGAKGALTLMVINKTATPLSVPVTLKNFVPIGSIETWRYDATNLNRIVHPGNKKFTGKKFINNFTANSITLLRIPGHS